MSNSNSQLDGLGSFNQSAKNAGTIKYGAFLNASQNLGTIALSATFGNTSQNLGTIGDIIPIITASIVQSNSANWDAAYTAVVSNSAVWILSGGSGSGDATNAPIWDAVAAYVQSASSTFLTLQDGSAIKWDLVASYVQSNSAQWNVSEWDSVYSSVLANSAAWMNSDTTNSPSWDAASSYVRSNSASLVFTNDSRLADVPNGNISYNYLQANSGSFVFTNDSRLTDSRTPISHTHDASAIVSGKLDVARLPIIPSQEQVIISGVMYTSSTPYIGGNDHFTNSLSSINQGTVVTTTDGYRWVYTGSGDKRYDSSYVLLADITPEWSAIANKPATFPVDGHIHDISDITNLQSSLNTLQSNIDGKQNSGDYALATDPRFTVLATNSAEWGSATVQGNAAYSYVNANSASLVFTSDSRLTDERTPLAHTHSISSINGLQSSLDGKASTSSLDNKADLSAFEGLNTLVQENSGTWEGVGIVYNYVRSNSAATVYSDDVRLARANTSFSYLTSTSASIVLTSDSRLTSGTTALSYVTANSASLVLTSDSRLTNGTTAYTYLNSNSGSLVTTSDVRLNNANAAYSSVTANSAAWSASSVGSINYTIDGGGAAITTGSKGFVQVPTNFVVQEWNIFADLQTTSFIVDVRKATYASLPTTTSIVGADTLTLTNQQKNKNSSVSWTNISAGDFLEFYVTEASNASMINISIKGIRS